MSTAKAEAWAKCMAARGLATDIQVRQASRAKNPNRAAYVYWTPRNVALHKQILADAQATREQRAVAERGNYEFHLDESGRWYWCLNLVSLEVYEVTVHTCDCGDQTHHLRGTGLACKHRLMLEMDLEEASTLVEQERQIEESRYAQMMNDFPVD